jgi:hypothetical protein
MKESGQLRANAPTTLEFPRFGAKPALSLTRGAVSYPPKADG